jgi:hypothetical protein
MPAIIKKYPIYVTDEPVSFKNFIGGINSDQSNEHLNDNEIRDGLNVHFQSGGLVKRKGAKLLATLISNQNILNVQGVFLFTYKITYLLLAADGKLFYGIYNPFKDISIKELPIFFYDVNELIINNPFNMKIGLKQYDSNSISLLPLNHDGYYFEYGFVYEGRNLNYIGEWKDLEQLNEVKPFDVVSIDNSYFTRINNTISINHIQPDEANSIYWEEITTENTDLVRLWNTKIVYIEQNEVFKFVSNNVLKVYRCIKGHFLKNNVNVIDNENFIKVFREPSKFVFQNRYNIEGATYKNFFYLTTGTRIVEVYIDERNVLVARVMLPKAIDSYVATEIGLNQLSPFPEQCLESFLDQAITGVNTVTVLHKKERGKNVFVLKPIMTIAQGDNINDYFFRWEKLVNGEWLTVIRFKDNYASTYIGDALSIERYNYTTLTVDDAYLYQYRVTIAKTFAILESPTETTETIYEFETLKSVSLQNIYDFKINKVIGDFFGQATSILYKEMPYSNFEIKDTGAPTLFQTIHSCKKVHADGNKFLFYDDNYNSGEWFKSIVDNPNYVALRGGLSFKTNKNESLIKVISFAGNIVAFANSENIGGSIHLVLGNGDDVESDRFYSPYRRKTISPEVSTDNADTVQVAENLLFFKHFGIIYFIQAGELDNERVTLYSANDKVKQKNNVFEIPWEDNDCISEVTEDYYSLIWPEKNIVENNEVLKIRDALRVKLYFKFYSNQMGKIYFSWLRDESKVFNSKHILYINKKPMYLYNNSLVTMHEDYYKDFDEVYPAKVVFKSYDLQKPKMYKLLDNITLFYNRNQNSNVDFTLLAQNEAGHTILEYENKDLTQNRATLKVGDKLNNDKLKLDSTLIDSKVINSAYKFPFLLVQVTLINLSTELFSFGSLTFNYSTVDIPDTNPYALYKDIVRRDGVFRLTSSQTSNLLESQLREAEIQGATSQVTTVGTLVDSGPRIFITRDAPLETKDGDLWYDIED